MMIFKKYVNLHVEAGQIKNDGTDYYKNLIDVLNSTDYSLYDAILAINSSNLSKEERYLNSRLEASKRQNKVVQNFMVELFEEYPTHREMTDEIKGKLLIGVYKKFSEKYGDQTNFEAFEREFKTHIDIWNFAINQLTIE